MWLHTGKPSAVPHILMKLVVIGGSDETAGTIALILKVRWADLRLIHYTEPSRAAEEMEKECPDLVMPCVDTPAQDWFELVARVRASSDVPLVVLSRSNDVLDKVRALEMGADDWITRSCLPLEFVAKVNAVLRRCGRIGAAIDALSSPDNGKFCIDHSSRRVRVKGGCVKLTRIEYKLLVQLVRRPGSVVRREELLDRVWGSSYGADPDFLKKYIRRLRCKLEEDPSHPTVILNERGVGYVFAAPRD